MVIAFLPRPRAERLRASRPACAPDDGPGARRLEWWIGGGTLATLIISVPGRRSLAALGPNFNLDLKVENTDLARLNDLLRAYGKFDVAAGQLSVYSQMKVARGYVDGYVKPLFRDVTVSAPETKDEKTVGQKVKEKVIGAAFKILKNRPRREVATQVNISGPLQNAQA